MRTICALLALCVAGCAHLSCHLTPTEAPASLAAAESAFALRSVRDGMRAAFLATFAEEGVMLRSAWVNSNAYLRARPDPPIVLDWRPVYVEVAASGELGLSTGPWKLTSKSEPDAAPAFGQYVSIWKRSAEGTWQVVVDLGISHPSATLWETPLEALAPCAPPLGAAEGIEAAEARFALDSRQSGLRAGYSSHASERVRLYREGAGPVLGKTEALATAAPEGGRLFWTVERSELSRSQDFGYARGHYAADSPHATTLGHFLRVWRREADGWRIALDITLPLAAR